MTRIFTLESIREALRNVNVVGCMEEGFAAYSAGTVIVPPVGELLFEEPRGEVHIKYGYIRGDEFYVIKIASGFYENEKYGLPVGSGMNLVFERRTGRAACVLLDEGYLTNVRTAAAGAVVAKYLAPRKVDRIGVLGTGVQARLQVQYLASVIASREIVVWGRRLDAVERYSAEMSATGYRVAAAKDPQVVAESCNLIITATAATAPLLTAEAVRRGTHITAMGSDTPGKIELDPRILAAADVIVADSISQCVERGEIAHAVAAGILSMSRITELGNIVADPRLGRSQEDQITVADLTGVAVQDIQISKAVYRNLMR